MESKFVLCCGVSSERNVHFANFFGWIKDWDVQAFLGPREKAVEASLVITQQINFNTRFMSSLFMKHLLDPITTN